MIVEVVQVVESFVYYLFLWPLVAFLPAAYLIKMITRYR